MIQDEQQIINFLNYISSHPWLMVLFYALAVWSLVWKGFALWKSAQSGSRNWFIALLLLNTVGILEIIYIFYFSKKKETGLPADR